MGWSQWRSAVHVDQDRQYKTSGGKLVNCSVNVIQSPVYSVSNVYPFNWSTNSRQTVAKNWHNSNIPGTKRMCVHTPKRTRNTKCMRVACGRENEGRLKGLCLLFYELGLYIGFRWGCALLIVPDWPHLLSQCWLAACTAHPGAFRPGCPRY